MKVLSVNLAQPRTIIFEGRAEQTGIYKSSVDQPIYLDDVDVHHDQVIDRIHHGWVDKACYLYGLQSLPFLARTLSGTQLQIWNVWREYHN